MDNDLNFAPCGFLSFNDNGIIIAINQTLADWLGYQQNELVGQNIERIFTVASRIFYNTHFFPLIRLHSKADEIFLTLVGKEKNDVPVLSNTVRRSEGDTFVNNAVFIPVFQRQKYETELLNARRDAENALKENKELGQLTKDLERHAQELDRQYQRSKAINDDLIQFGKIVSHDLQEPIRKVQLFTGIMADAGALDEKQRSVIPKIYAAAERLRALTLGLQQYVGIDAEQRFVEVNLNEIVENAKMKVVMTRTFNNFHFHADKLPVIEGYRAQLELLFYHLLDNAVQFRRPDVELSVTVSAVTVEENVYRATQNKYKFTEFVRMVVADNGVGFEDVYKTYVFGLLKKINAGSEGLGIGLSIVKKIVDNHNGFIDVESEEGRGTRFMITLPRKMH